MGERERPRPRPDRSRNDTYTAFDRAMIRCKEDGREVRFEMATGNSFTGMIVSVDKFAIEIFSASLDESIWLMKAMIETATPQGR